MKKLLFVAMLGVAGLMSAKGVEDSIVTKEKLTSNNKKEVRKIRKCEGVELSCGEYVFACGEPNSDGELDWELKDDLRQLGEEVFC